jgi:hypothetical protein
MATARLEQTGLVANHESLQYGRCRNMKYSEPADEYNGGQIPVIPDDFGLLRPRQAAAMQQVAGLLLRRRRYAILRLQ